VLTPSTNWILGLWGDWGRRNLPSTQQAKLRLPLIKWRPL